MKLAAANPKRYGIYVFYDKDGVVDRYNDVFLEGLKKETAHLLVIVNGSVREEGRMRLEAIADEIRIRENVGYDVTAYKEGILGLGRLGAEDYDEIVVCNDTMYGPLYPFGEMFDAMAQRDLDFWGITNFHEVPFDPFGTVEYGYLPRHVQSFFMVFRKSLTQTEDFWTYWESLPAICGYEEAIGFHEAVFTKKFADRGYRWEVYADSSDLEGYTYDPLRDFPRYLVEEKRCPVIKKRSFYHEYGEAMERSGGEATREVFDYIDGSLAYDCDLIWENLLRTQNMADLKKRMQLNYIVPSGHLRRKEKYRGKVALVLHIYYPELAAFCRKYAEHMPEGTDVYITVPDEECGRKVRKAFGGFPFHTEYRVTGNRGRDVAPFLVGCRDLIDRYDLICKVHDKKVSQIRPMSLGESWAYECFENLLKTPCLAENILTLFDRNPRLGMLTPPIPVHGPYYPTTGKGEWGANYGKTKEVYDMLGLHVPIDGTKEPVAPLGSMFWARTAALRPLFSHAWICEEMPREPVADDATILHAIERVYPFCVQEAGYYTGWVMADAFAGIELDNLSFINEELRRAEFSRYGKRPLRELLNVIKG